MTDTKIDTDPSYKGGWMYCRMAAFDESEGYVEDSPGVHVRIRIKNIIAYFQATQTVAELYVEGFDERLAIIGNVQQIDKIIARETVKTVHNV